MSIKILFIALIILIGAGSFLYSCVNEKKMIPIKKLQSFYNSKLHQ